MILRLESGSFNSPHGWSADAWSEVTQALAMIPFGTYWACCRRIDDFRYFFCLSTFQVEIRSLNRLPGDCPDPNSLGRHWGWTSASGRLDEDLSCLLGERVRTVNQDGGIEPGAAAFIKSKSHSGNIKPLA